MRLRLGLLRDTAAIEKQAAREAADAAAKKHKQSIPTVKTQAQTLADEKAAREAAKDKSKTSDASKAAPKPRIRPLSEAKAIESGATFISEAFLFGVAGSLIIFESWRSRRKENTRREDVADRLGELEESERAARRALVELEREVLALRAKHEKGGASKPGRRILPRDIWVQEEEEKEDEATTQGWLSRISGYIMSKKDPAAGKEATSEAGPAEKILAASDAALAAKHKEALEAPKAGANNTETNLPRKMAR
jgi:optic atrophy 3 protein